MPRESVPNTKEEADKIIKQARAVLEEMYEKQSILDSTKTQVRNWNNMKTTILICKSPIIPNSLDFFPLKLGN